MSHAISIKLNEYKCKQNNVIIEKKLILGILRLTKKVGCKLDFEGCVQRARKEKGSMQRKEFKSQRKEH